jgi:ribose transport system ATP-binding protein
MKATEARGSLVGGPGAAVLELDGIRKAFGATQALDGVSFQLLGGEIHGLVGHNGAGKSTLVKILSGYHSPDEGKLRLRGQDVAFPIRQAGERGLAVVQQDRALIEHMSIRDNIAVASTARWSDWFLPVHRKREASISRQALREFGIEGYSEEDTLESLPESLRPVIAIVRAVCQVETFREPGILILDEPTASLTGPDASRVLNIVRRVAARGHGVVFISHRLGEVGELCDRVTVLRSGRVVANLNADELSKARLVRAITGESALGEDVGTAEGETQPGVPPVGSSGTREVVMEVSDVRGERLSHLSIQVRAGEVLVITGLRGSGYEEFVPALLGRAGTAVGSISVFGHRVANPSPAAIRRANVAIVPRDRKRRGLWMGATLAENLTIVDLKPFRSRVLHGLDNGAEMTYASRLLREFNVFPPKAEATIEHLSGGNQQKVLFARELGALQGRPMVVLAEEPVEAVDASTRSEIARMLRGVRDTGGAAVVVTDDSDFIIGLADRVIVIADGVLVGELNEEEITEVRLLEMCQTSAVSA